MTATPCASPARSSTYIAEGGASSAARSIPVHNAHLFIAEAVRAQCGLERVIFLPTLNAHHRESITASVDDRAQMLRLAIASNPAFALDLTDTTPEATGYTADLIPRLRARYPDERFTFIAGGDWLVRSPWRRLDEVLAQVDAFVVAPRGDSWVAQLDATLAPFAADLRAKVAMLDLPRFTESATIMRTRLAEGRTVRYLVPEPSLALHRGAWIVPIAGPRAMIAFDWRTEVAPGHTRGHDGSLAIGGVAVDALARAYGTPLLAFDLGVFDEAVETFAGACAPHGIEIAYAAKALIFIALARRLIATPLHIDICRSANCAPSKRPASPPSASRCTVAARATSCCRRWPRRTQGTIVVDGIDELARLAALSTVAPVSVVLRVNAGIEAHTHAFVRTAGEDTKFGLDPTELPEAFARIAGAGSLRLSGLHSHIGSQIYDAAPFVANVEALATFAAAARSAGLHAKQWILGGGFGVGARAPANRARSIFPR